MGACEIVPAAASRSRAMLASIHELTSKGKVPGIERSFPYYDGVALVAANVGRNDDH